MISTTGAQGRNVSLAAGQVVGSSPTNQWVINEHIAEGGFASVYAVKPASDETSAIFGSTLRALKALPAKPAEITQINTEAEKIATVEGHENVLGLVTSFTFDLPNAQPCAALILEYAEEDLYGFATRLRPDEHAWAGILEQIAAGLEHIHSRGIIHGDVKPTNAVRVGHAFKIADFGVSTPMASEAGSTLTRTPAYLPPEASPDSAWTPTTQSDVWACGVSIHRLLTGRHITAGITAEQQHELVRQGRYSIDDRLGDGWRRFFADCLAHNPKDRTITDAATLRQRLAELAVPQDYDGVPWPPGTPRMVTILPGVAPQGAERSSLVLFMTRPTGRVHGMFSAPDDVLLDASRHLYETALPSLAQQVRDFQRAATRAAEERDRLQEELGRIAAAGPNTEVMTPQETTSHLARMSEQVTTAVREREQITAERDRLAREQEALARRVGQLQYEIESVRRSAMTDTLVPGFSPEYDAYAAYDSYGEPTRDYPRRSRLTTAGFTMVTIVLAAAIGLLIGSAVTAQAPGALVHDVITSIHDRLSTG